MNRYRQVTSSRLLPRVGHPRGQQPGQHLITDRIPRIAVGAEVVFEVVQQQQHRHVVQDMAAEDGQPVLPAQVGPPGDVEGPDRRSGVLAALISSSRRMAVITAPSRPSRVSGPVRLTRTRPGSRSRTRVVISAASVVLPVPPIP